MHVAVDEAGHQHTTAAIDRRRAIDLDRPVGDLTEAVAFDKDLIAATHFVKARIEQTQIPEQQKWLGLGRPQLCLWCHAKIPGRLRLSQARPNPALSRWCPL
jgi:hypothetical protein